MGKNIPGIGDSQWKGPKGSACLASRLCHLHPLEWHCWVSLPIFLVPISYSGTYKGLPLNRGPKLDF